MGDHPELVATDRRVCLDELMLNLEHNHRTDLSHATIIHHRSVTTISGPLRRHPVPVTYDAPTSGTALERHYASGAEAHTDGRAFSRRSIESRRSSERIDVTAFVTAPVELATTKRMPVV